MFQGFMYLVYLFERNKIIGMIFSYQISTGKVRQQWIYLKLDGSASGLPLGSITLSI
jgi:hypothetical protein